MATRRRSPRVGRLPTFNVKAVGLDKTKPVVAADIKVSTSAIGSEESKSGLAQTPVATRIAIGGLLGAGVGAGIGVATRKQGKKRSLAVPAAAGGAAGMLLALVHDVISNKDSAVNKDSVTQTTDSTKPSRPQIVVTATKVGLPKDTPRAIRECYENRGPKGWLSQLLQHGGMCIAYEMHYLKDRNHLNPIMAASWKQSGSSSGSFEGEPDFDFSRNTLMCNRFAEQQAPVWDWMAPCLWNHGEFGATKDYYYASIVYDIASTNYAEGAEVNEGASRKFYSAESTPNLLNDVANSFYAKHMVIGRDYSEHPDEAYGIRYGEIKEKDYIGGGTDPGYRVSRWRSWVVDKHAHQTAGRNYREFPAYNSEVPKVPLYYDLSKGRRLEFKERMARWLDNAQWFVWACEMARLHHPEGRGKHCPKWWAAHANAWGISTPKWETQKNRKTYVDFVKEKEDELYYGLELTGWDWKYWEEVARTVISVTHLPGEVHYRGEQIAIYDEVTDKSYPRHILDMPLNCGMVPPSMLVDGAINQALLNNWAMHTEMKDAWDTYIVPIAKAVFSLVASFMSGIVQVAFQIIQMAINVIIQLVRFFVAMAHGQDFDWAQFGTILFNIGVVTAAALSASGVEISVAEALPEGVWQALTDIKAALPSWGGAMSGSVKDAALSLRDDLIHLRDVTKWDFLEEAYSTMIDGDLRMDMVADRLSS